MAFRAADLFVVYMGFLVQYVQDASVPIEYHLSSLLRVSLPTRRDKTCMQQSVAWPQRAVSLPCVTGPMQNAQESLLC